MNRFMNFFIILIFSTAAFGNGDDWSKKAKPKGSRKEKHSVQKMESHSPSQNEKKTKEEKHFYEEKGMYRKQL